ncbi:universal stress protein [Acetilactobacillus jinshanensis]|uniref:universal stress protein n=1 Tax=Acetilactobacillus jinshanensis TaxID=1720083 RepID=UPI003CE585E7
MAAKKQKQYTNILVPVDSSHNSKLALLRALDMAERHPDTTKLHIAHVINEVTNFAGASDQFILKMTNNDRKMLNKYLKVAKEHHVKADIKIMYGSPKATIAHDLTDLYHPDLIVMGAIGLSKIERVLLGSVAVYVSREAPCDVLLVKEDHQSKAKAKK